MGFEGMNVAQINALSRDLLSYASRVNAVRGSVDSIVQRTQANWAGQDATHFATGWQTSRASLTALVQDLQTLGNRAKSQAAMQARISGQ